MNKNGFSGPAAWNAGLERPKRPSLPGQTLECGAMDSNPANIRKMSASLNYLLGDVDFHESGGWTGISDPSRLSCGES